MATPEARVLRDQVVVYERWARLALEDADRELARGNGGGAAIQRGLARMHELHAAAAREGRRL